MTEPPRAILLGRLGHEQLMECPGCHLRMRTPRFRGPRAGPPRPRVPRHTLSYATAEDRELEAALAARSRLEGLRFGQLNNRLVRQGWLQDPHTHKPGGTP